jgi:hypothetical protein
VLTILWVLAVLAVVIIFECLPWLALHEVYIEHVQSSDGRRSLAWELLQSLEQLRGSSSSLENGTQTVDAQGGDFMGKTPPPVAPASN